MKAKQTALFPRVIFKETFKLMRHLRYLALPAFCYRYKLLQYKVKADLLGANSVDLFSQSLIYGFSLEP